MRLLLSLGANPRLANAQRRTPLHYAASKGRIGIVPMLLESGADVSARDCTGANPLHR